VWVKKYASYCALFRGTGDRFLSRPTGRKGRREGVLSVPNMVDQPVLNRY